MKEYLILTIDSPQTIQALAEINTRINNYASIGFTVHTATKYYILMERQLRNRR